MQIKDFKIQIVSPEKVRAGLDVSLESEAYRPKRLPEIPVLTIITDEGIEGTSFGMDGLRQALYLETFKPFLVGEDPLYVEKIWQKMWGMTRTMSVPESVLGTIDIAIWDIVGKAVNLPIYKVLGAYRDKVMAYASVIPLDHLWTLEEYVQHALECKASRWTPVC